MNVLMKRKNKKGGFTLIEILVVIGILAILATLVLVAVNPNKQFKAARNTKRAADVATILSAVSQNIIDNSGIFACEGGPFELPPDSIVIGIADVGMGVDLAPCLIPDYIAAFPVDPTAEGAVWNTETDYMTGYFIKKDSLGRVTVSATGEGVESVISATR